jgi:hypothetical protein
MKTCSFRGSHARFIDVPIDSLTEGLFCIDPPDTRYLMLPCNNPNCPCCYQSLDISRRHEPSVRLALKEAHRFVNGYQAYLNCHAVYQSCFFFIESSFCFYRIVKPKILSMFSLVLVVNLILLVVVIIQMNHLQMYFFVRVFFFIISFQTFL